MAEISWKRKPGQKLAPLAERLKKLGLVSDWDFVLHLPLRYEDETSITPIEELEVGVDARAGQPLRAGTAGGAAADDQHVAAVRKGRG